MILLFCIYVVSLVICFNVSLRLTRDTAIPSEEMNSALLAVMIVSVVPILNTAVSLHAIYNAIFRRR